MVRLLPAVMAAAASLSAQTPNTTRDSLATRDPFRVVGARVWTLRVDSGSRAATRSFSQELTGKLPGVLVMPSSGTIGAGSRVLLRGVTSAVLSNAPLVYVDGVRVEALARPDAVSLLLFGVPESFRLDDLNSEDIASVEVLPGPAAAARFGTDAANGVLLISTRRGEAGSPRWHVFSEQGLLGQSVGFPDSYLALDSLGNQCTLIRMTNGQCEQARVLRGNTLDSRGTSPLMTGAIQSYGTDVSGSVHGVRVFTAGRLDTDGGIYGLPRAERDRLASPPDFVLNPNYLRRTFLRGTIEAPIGSRGGVEVTVGRSTSDGRFPRDDPSGSLVLRDGLSTRVDTTSATAWDTLYRVTGQHAVERWTGSISGHWSPIAALSFAALVGRDHTDDRDNVFGDSVASLPVTSAVHAVSRRSTIRLTGSYEMSLNPVLRSRTSLVFERTSRDFDYRNSQSAFGLTSYVTLQSTEALSGYLLGEDVTYRERLVVSAAVRDDRPRFYRAELYPSVSVSYLVPADLGGRVDRWWVSVAYGVAGGTAGSLGSVRTERTREFEVSTDAELFQGRLGAKLTAYDKRTGNALAFVPLPPLNIYGYANAATISNRGVEGALTFRLLRGPSLSADLALGFWGNRNRVLRLDGPPYIFFGDQAVWAGLPVGSYLGWPYRYADRDGNGIIDTSEVSATSTLVFAGAPFPSQGASLSAQVAVRNRLHVYALFEYRGGHRLLNLTEGRRCAFAATCRATNDPTAPLADQARSVARNLFVSGFGGSEIGYIEGADFGRLRELGITITAPNGRMGASALRLTLAGRNLFKWTRYGGLDPEVNANGENSLAVSDAFTQPPLRYWTARLDVEF